MNKNNSYAADVGDPQYEKFLKTATPNSTPIQLGREWAWRCMVGSPGNSGNAGNAGNANSSNNASICKAVYYRLDNSKSECKNLNPETIKAVDFPIDCLERVVVGTGPDFGEIRNRKNDDVTRTVLAEREDRLKNRDGTVPSATALAERNFANWFSYYRTRFLTLKTVLSRVFNDLPPTVRFGYQNLSVEGSYLPGEVAFISLADTFAPYADNRKTFFDWLFDSRAQSTTYLVSAAARVHEFCATPQVYVEQPMSEGGELIQSEDVIVNPLRGCRNNFHVIFTDGFWEDTIWVPSARGSAFTGLKPPKAENDPHLWLGNNDATKKDLPPDSASAAASGLASETYDPDQDYARIFADQNIGMLADVVFASWITDLRPDEPAAEHRVPTLIRVPKGSTDTPEDYFWNPANDPADWQHITTYTIGLGVAGNVSYPEGTWTSDSNPCEKPDDEECKNISIDGFPGAWNAIGGTATSPNANLIPAAVKIDDTWHAGINGRGDYLNAGDAAALAAAFSNVLDAVSTLAKDSSAAAVAVNTGTTASQDIIYQARLNATGWSGDIRSYQVSAGKGKDPCPTLDIRPGQLCQDPSRGQYYQSAAQAMRDLVPDDRRIFTTANGAGTAFRWDNLTNTQQLDFLTGAGFSGTNPARASQAQIDEAKARLAYVAGDRTYEDDGETYRFRTRALLSPSCTEPPGCTNLLGDFINAAPVIVGAPAFDYNAPGYQSAVGTNATSFMQAHAKRTPLIYAGANDGMLHAFDAATLEESFAFVPPVLMGLTGVTGAQIQRPGRASGTRC
ncbi:PilC/PilY family type IV pilus protein [uncultured Lamprocystis sp.]|jgi:type IV pilus assembly protein PilY1|uniref:PilC/PilY family type IV pilus protein n=1 Tax=uncultured Lamprocystis sp. TaxID=543132 RepID=UPI0025DBA414|nr:PilC/PilY family type IV pilus protein [uncultured Lamprocystis sp.]